MPSGEIPETGFFLNAAGADVAYADVKLFLFLSIIVMQIIML